MSAVQIHTRPPRLHRPVLVAAFTGWNDAGEAASGAVATLKRATGATPFADVDPEEFFDFQVVRPRVQLVDGGSRRIDWPSNEFSWGELPSTGRHVVLLAGTEPNYRWRAFTHGVVDLAQTLGVELVVTLGALQIDVPHTRPVPVTASASSRAMATRLGLRPSVYEGPTGITGVLHHACGAADLSSVSMWAGVPHYLANTAYLPAGLALAERVVSLVGADLSLDRLARDAIAQRDEVAELVAADDDLAEYVTELEQRTEVLDLAEGDAPMPAASGDELAAELERFLRERGS